MNNLKYIVVLAFLITNELFSSNDKIDRELNFTTYHVEQMYDLHILSADYIFGIASDTNNVLFLGTNKHILVYDGVRIQQVAHPFEYITIGIDRKNAMFYGSDKEFGIIRYHNNTMSFISLYKFQSSDNITHIKNIKIHGDKVFFISSPKIFILEKDKIRVFKARSYFVDVVFYGDRVSFIDKQFGYGLLVRDKIAWGRNSDQKRKIVFQYILPNNIKLCISERGNLECFRSDKYSHSRSLNAKTLLTFSDFKTSLSASKYLAVGIDGYGIVIVDKDGDVKSYLNSRNVLKSNEIDRMHYVNEVLWVISNGMLYKITNNNCISMADYSSILDGYITDLVKFKNIIYVSSTVGLFRLYPMKLKGESAKVSFKLKKVRDIVGPCYKLYTNNSALYIGGASGYVLKNNSIKMFFNKGETVTGFAGLRNKRLLISTSKGLYIHDFKRDQYTNGQKKIIDGKYGFSLCGNGINCAWLTTLDNEIYSVSDSGNQPLRICKYSLPASAEGRYIKTVYYGDHPLFCLDDGIYYYDVKHNRIAYDSSHRYYNDNNERLVYDPIECGRNNQLWLWSNTNSTLMLENIFNGVQHFKQQTAARIILDKLINRIYEDDDKALWIVGRKYIYKYFYLEKAEYYTDDKCLITSIYCGDKPYFDFLVNHKRTKYIRVFDNNNISINLTVVGGTFQKEAKYRYCISGLDQKWSNYSTLPMIYIKEIPSGRYNVIVQYKNIFGDESKYANVGIEIFPNLFNTWWMCLVYFILSVVMSKLLISVKQNVKNINLLRKEKLILVKKNVSLDEMLLNIKSENSKLWSLEKSSMKIIERDNLTELLYTISTELRSMVTNLLYIEVAFSKNDTQISTEKFGNEDESVNYNITLNDWEHKIDNLFEGVGVYGIKITKDIIFDIEQTITIIKKYNTNKEMVIDLKILSSVQAYINHALKRLHFIRNIEKKNNELEKDNFYIMKDKLLSIRNINSNSISTIMTGVAQEIRNPLSFINNYSELIIKYLQPLLVGDLNHSGEENKVDEQLDKLKLIETLAFKTHQQGLKMTDVIRSLLFHTRNVPDLFTGIDINMLVDEFSKIAFYGFHSDYPDFGVTIKHEYDENIGKVDVIPSEISQAILAVMENAFYSIKEKKSITPNFLGSVEIKTKQISEKYYEIRIYDNGIGVQKSDVRKLYYPGFKSNLRPNANGLGLSYLYESIVRLHHGEIEILSNTNMDFQVIIRLRNAHRTPLSYDIARMQIDGVRGLLDVQLKM